jgi:hypothetical protein
MITTEIQSYIKYGPGYVLGNGFVVCYYCGTVRKESCHTTNEAKECFYYNERKLHKNDDQD